jgi:hypothetical protein
VADAEAYIAQYGAGLTDAEQRYIRAFGAPEFKEGPSRNPATAGLRIADAPDLTPDDDAAAVTGANLFDV